MGLSFGNYMCIFWLCHHRMSLTNPLMAKSKRVQAETFTGPTLGAKVTILTLAQSVLKLKQGYSKDNSPSCNLVTTRKWYVCLSCIVGPTELMPPWFLTGPRPNSKFPIQPCLRPETTDQACLHRARGYLVL